MILYMRCNINRTPKSTSSGRKTSQDAYIVEIVRVISKLWGSNFAHCHCIGRQLVVPYKPWWKSAPCKNGQTNRDAVWSVDSWEPKTMCYVTPESPTGKGTCHSHIGLDRGRYSQPYLQGAVAMRPLASGTVAACLGYEECNPSDNGKKWTKQKRQDTSRNMPPETFAVGTHMTVLRKSINHVLKTSQLGLPVH